MLAALLALAAAAPLKVAVMPVSSGEGVPGKTAEALTESVTAEVRRRSGAQVITQRDVATLLSLEQQKAMLGCQNDACFAEIGGALGVDRVVSGDLSRLGESWLFHLRLLDAAKAQVLTTSDRRLRGGTIDDLLDALPAMVGELFPPAPRPAAPPAASLVPDAAPGAAARTPAAGRPPGEGVVTPATVQLPPSAAQPPKASPPAEEPGPLPPPTAPMPGRAPARAVRSARLERSIPVPLRVRADLKVFADPAGDLLALAPFGGEGLPVFFGRKGKLYRQEVAARREQDTTGYGVALWEPRAPGGKALVAIRGEEALVRCGDQDLTLTALPRAQGVKVLVEATYYAPPFVRRPVALARDDEGNYFYVDAQREPALRGPEYHLYAGPKGALARLEIEEVGSEGRNTVLRTGQGRLRLAGEGERGQADWLADGGRRMLAWLDPARNLPLVFGELGVYGAEPLGTACDPVFAAAR